MRAKVLHTEPDASAGEGCVFADIDISNCFPTLLFNFICKSEGDERAKSTYPFLSSYTNYKREWRGLVAETWGISEKQAKKILISLNHNGLPHVDDPLLWALARDFQRAGDVMLGSDEFSYLKDRFMTRPNPMSTKMHYALVSIEDNIITALEEAINELDSTNVNTLMFDGLIVRLADSDRPKTARHLDTDRVQIRCPV